MSPLEAFIVGAIISIAVGMVAVIIITYYD